MPGIAPNPAARPAPRTIARLPRSRALDLSPIFMTHANADNGEEMGLVRRMREVQRVRKWQLTYNVEERGLQVWPWPVDGLERVEPTELYTYAQTHEMPLPHCFCAIKNPTDTETEAKITISTTGALSGEYIIRCAKTGTARCRFFGLLERNWNSLGHPVKIYPRRNSFGPIPAPRFIEEDRVATTRRRRRSEEDNSDNTPPRPTQRRRLARVDTSIIQQTPPQLPVEQPFDLLLKLDDCSYPGIPEQQFVDLFVKCSTCKIYTTRSAFQEHRCPARAAGVIDLSNDSD